MSYLKDNNDNFSNSDLTFGTNRSHNLQDNKLTIDNGQVEFKQDTGVAMTQWMDNTNKLRMNFSLDGTTQSNGSIGTSFYINDEAGVTKLSFNPFHGFKLNAGYSGSGVDMLTLNPITGSGVARFTMYGDSPRLDFVDSAGANKMGLYADIDTYIFNTGKVGIGNSNPSTSLHVTGGFRLDDGSHGVGKVLTSDANGLASWQTIGADQTFANTNFTFTEGRLHNLNNFPLEFSNAKIGINKSNPDEALHVVGNLKIEDGNQGAGKVLTSDANGVATWQNDASDVVLEKCHVVDAINGDDGTAVKGSLVKKYKTILAAQTAAVAGETVLVTTDVQEWTLGKDGLTYYFLPGTRLFKPLNEVSGSTNNPANELWSDRHVGSAISYKVIGGKHEIDSGWNAVDWDRCVVRLDHGSNVEFINVESFSNVGEDGYAILVLGGSKCTAIVKGDVYTGSGCIWIGGTSSHASIEASGEVVCRGRIISYWSSTQEDGFAKVKAGKAIRYIGHPYWNVRNVIYCGWGINGGKINRAHLEAPIIEWDDQYESVGATGGSFVFRWTGGCNHEVTLKADVLKMKHQNRATATGIDQDLFMLRGVPANGFMKVNMDVRTVALDKFRTIEQASYSAGNKDNIIIKWLNCDIVSSDETLTGVFFNTLYYTHHFEGTNRIVLHDTAIAAGAKAIGNGATGSAMIAGVLLSNGDVDDTQFTDLLTGLPYSSQQTRMYMNHSSINYTDSYSTYIL